MQKSIFCRSCLRVTQTKSKGTLLFMPFCSNCKAFVSLRETRCVGCGFTFGSGYRSPETGSSFGYQNPRMGSNMLKATKATQELFFVEFKPGPQNSGDPVEDFLVNGANEEKTTRSSLFDYLMRANMEDIPSRVSFFDGKQEIDISKFVSKVSLRSAALKTGVWKWGGPTGPFSSLYLYGPVLWEFEGSAPPTREQLDNSMPTWAMDY